jgi:sugar lactone lactonase YvrE
LEILENSFYAAEFSPVNPPGQILLATAAHQVAMRGVAGGTTQRAMMWDLAQGNLVWETSLYGGAVGLSFSPDGAQLAVTEYGYMSLMPAEAGVKKATLPALESTGGVAFYPDGTRIAYTECSGRVRVWDLTQRAYSFVTDDIETGDVCRLFGWVRIRLSTDGRLLVVAGPDHQVRLFDANSGELLHTLMGHQERLYGLALSADGTLLAAGSEDATITVWDVASATLLYRLTGHIQGITGLAFSPDGKLLASADWDGLTKLWDLGRRQERLTLYHEGTGAYSASFSPDGKFLAVAGNAVRIFLPRVEDLVALARERLTRSLSTEECQQFLRLEACPESSGYTAPLN